jgi:spermidine/putrescine transport system substrate-binding protein
MKYEKISIAIIRTGIILFWMIVIFLVYQLPDYVSPFTEQRTLYIATWPLLLDAQKLVEFEQQTGIKLKITYFESSEELLSKVQATEGAGYDIIFPSDYTVASFIKQGLLKKLDKSKLSFWNDLDKRLLHAYFDPHNEYTIPFYWAAYGMGINKKLFGDNPPDTWGLIFDKAYKPEHIIMTNSPREAISISALYLLGSLDALKIPENQERVRNALIAQKSWVDLYTEERLDELLASENNNLVFGLSTDITRAIRKNKDIIFMVPKEGSFIVIDSIAIPAKSKNEELAYKFINYIYQPEIVDHHIRLYNMCSPITSNRERSGYAPDDIAFSKLHFLVDSISESGLNTIWIDLLAN